MDYPQDPGVGLHEGKFTDGDAGAGIPASLDPADWANLVTDELLAFLTAASITPDFNNAGQVLQAARALGLRSASTTQTGVSELATNAEALAGTDTARVVPASALAYVLAQRMGPKWLASEVEIVDSVGTPTWTTVDLAASIPSGATTAIIAGRLGDDRGESTLYVRPYGDSGAGLRVVQVAGLGGHDSPRHISQFLCPLSDRKFQYQVTRTDGSAAVKDYGLWLQGYQF